MVWGGGSECSPSWTLSTSQCQSLVGAVGQLLFIILSQHVGKAGLWEEVCCCCCYWLLSSVSNILVVAAHPHLCFLFFCCFFSDNVQTVTALRCWMSLPLPSPAPPLVPPWVQPVIGVMKRLTGRQVARDMRNVTQAADVRGNAPLRNPTCSYWGGVVGLLVTGMMWEVILSVSQ